MDKYKDFWSVILGKQPIGLTLGYFVIAYVAAVGMILIMASQKYKAVPNSPEKWSWKYFWANNSGNFLACLFVMPILIRVIIEFISDSRWMLLISVGLGFGFYRLAKIANKYGIWTTDKISEKIADKVKSIQEKKD